MFPSVLKNIPLRQYPWFLNVQFINLIIPLISFPYLLRILGPEKWGIVAVASSVGLVGTTLSEYGFSFIGIRDISRLSENTEKLSKYFSTAILTRIVVFLCCSVLFATILYFIPELRSDTLLFVLTFISIAPNLFYSQWIYVGLQKIRQYNYILVINKFLNVVLVFVLISDVSDYELYPLVNLVPACFSAISSVWFLHSIGIRIQPVSVRNVTAQLQDGLYTFLSQSLTSLYVQINPILLLALIHDAKLIGYYAVAEKVVVSVRSTISPISQLYLPYISKRFQNMPSLAINELRSYAKFIGTISVVVMLLLMTFSKPLVGLFAGDEFMPAYLVVILLSPIIVLISLNNLAGVHTLLNIGKQKEFFYGILFGGFANIFITVTCVPLFSYTVAALSWVISEIIVLLIFLYFIKKSDIAI